MRNTTTSVGIALCAGSMALAGLAGCAVHEREIVTTRSYPVTREVREEVVVRPPMPAPRVEIRTIQPAPDLRWVDGHYEWSGSAWQWSPGYWAP
jgi:hypothetical protein